MQGSAHKFADAHNHRCRSAEGCADISTEQFRSGKLGLRGVPCNLKINPPRPQAPSGRNCSRRSGRPAPVVHTVSHWRLTDAEGVEGSFGQLPKADLTTQVYQGVRWQLLTV
jgi:hypothetical protein